MLASSAFLASAAGTRTLQDQILHAGTDVYPDTCFNSALAHWSTQCSSPPPDSHHAGEQKQWDMKIVNQEFDALLSRTTEPLDRARLLAAQSPHSGDWLHALPIEAIGLHMSNDAVRIAAGIRLGSKLCEPHTCMCGSKVDHRGLHGLSCKKTKGKYYRHREVNEVISRAINSAGIPCAMEPTGLSRTASNKRPDGITIIPWSYGRCMTWDVTVPDTYAQSYLSKTSVEASAAADTAVTRKNNKYADIAQRYLFAAIAVESSGCWSEASLRTVKDIGRRISARTGDTRETTFLLQRLSIAVQRGNALSVLETTSHLIFDFSC